MKRPIWRAKRAAEAQRKKNGFGKNNGKKSLEGGWVWNEKGIFESWRKLNVRSKNGRQKKTMENEGKNKKIQRSEKKERRGRSKTGERKGGKKTGQIGDTELNWKVWKIWTKERTKAVGKVER